MVKMKSVEPNSLRSTSLSTSQDLHLEINLPSPRRRKRSMPRQLRQISLKRSIEMTHLARHSSHCMMRSLLQFRRRSRKRRRDPSLLRLLCLPEELPRVLPLLMLQLVSSSSPLSPLSSRPIPIKLFFRPFKAYLLSSLETKESN